MTSIHFPYRSEGHPLRDSLTKALSRPQFGISLEQEKERSDLCGLPFVLCLIDIDKLRNVNDEYGLRVGDAVLAEVADRIRNRLDESDWDCIEYLHARFDGDALILLARDCSIRQGSRLAESLRAAISESPVWEQLRVTVSISVVQYRIAESTDALLSRVEKTLHLAKQFGRDRVEVAATPENGRSASILPLPKRPPVRRRRRIIA
jgi:diguanylate cyclase (GGDEF)-like protein